MREIKFRAFIKNEIGGFYIDEDSDCFMVSNGDGFGVYDEYKNLLPDNRIVIEQFTGSRDRNNNDIYEGDIVKSGSIERINTVIFTEGSFALKHEHHSPCLRHFGLSECEVIGNINENKDLLP